jgi:hypothetical protein
MKWIALALRCCSVLFALGAAGFWFRASIDKIPIRVREDIKNSGGPDLFGSHQIKIVDSLVNQNRLNAAAAACAGLAAMAQVGLELLAVFG